MAVGFSSEKGLGFALVLRKKERSAINEGGVAGSGEQVPVQRCLRSSFSQKAAVGSQGCAGEVGLTGWDWRDFPAYHISPC